MAIRSRRLILGLGLLLLFFALVGLSLELPEEIQEATQSVVEMVISGECSRSGEFVIYGASGVILKEEGDSSYGSILTAGHFFWCDEDDPLERLGLMITLRREEGVERCRSRDLAECEPNPAWDTELDLALLKLDCQLPGGLEVGEARASQEVWLLGYGELAELTPIKGRVTEVEEGERIWIEADAPPKPGMSGSPVVTEESVVIGIVIAVAREDPKLVLATPATAVQSLQEMMVCPQSLQLGH